MTFHFSNAIRPIEIANRLQNELAVRGREIDLVTVRASVAIMLGHDGWQDLTDDCGCTEPSVDDVDCAPDIVRARSDAQSLSIEVLSGSRDCAREVIRAVHPTRAERAGGVVWIEKSHQISWYAFGDDVCYGIFKEPNLTPSSGVDASYLYHLRETGVTHYPMFSGSFAKDVGQFKTLLGAKIFAELAIADARENERVDIWPLARKMLSNKDLSLLKPRSQWGLAFRARSYGPGLLDVTTMDGWDGFRVSAELVRTIDPAFRPWSDVDGYGWYETTSEKSIVPALLPEFFTKSEVSESRLHLDLSRVGLMEVLAIERSDSGL